MTFFDQSERKECSYMDRMKAKIDSPMGRHIYSQRLGTVEPVLGNIEANKGSNQFNWVSGKELLTSFTIGSRLALRDWDLRNTDSREDFVTGLGIHPSSDFAILASLLAS